MADLDIKSSTRPEVYQTSSGGGDDDLHLTLERDWSPEEELAAKRK